MRARVWGALAAVSALTAACGGDGGGGLASGEDYSVLGALGELPASMADDGEVRIYTADLTAATEAAELERPTSVEGDALVDWIGTLEGFGVEPGGGQVFVPMAPVFNVNHLRRHEGFAEELGWSLLDVDSVVEVRSGPGSFAVVAGDFADSAPAGDERTEGVRSVGSGEDLQVNVDDTSDARPSGVPLHQAREEGRIAVTTTPAAAQDWLAGQEETLADDEPLAAAARALDDADVLSAMLFTGTFLDLETAVAGSVVVDADVEGLVDLVPADPFSAVGVGWGLDDAGTAEITLAYVFDDDAAAEAAVAPLERQFAEARTLFMGQSLEDLLTPTEVVADGPVTVVTASIPRGSSPRVVQSLLEIPDLPFVHR